MNTNKLMTWVKLALYSILLAFLIPVLFEWMKSGALNVDESGIRAALFFGLLVPVLLLLTKNIKNDYFLILLALVIIFAVLVFTRFAFYF